MKYLRIITPTGWIVIAGVAVVLFGLAGLARPSFLGLKFDPFGIDARKIDRLESQVSVLEREAVGQAQIATATETFHTRDIIIRDATSEAIAQARSAYDAATPLDPSRVDRIRDADNRLCSAYPAICPGADDADGSADAVQSPDAS